MISHQDTSMLRPQNFIELEDLGVHKARVVEALSLERAKDAFLESSVVLDGSIKIRHSILEDVLNDTFNDHVVVESELRVIVVSHCF